VSQLTSVGYFLTIENALHYTPEGVRLKSNPAVKATLYVNVKIQASALRRNTLSISLSVFGGLISLAPIGLEALDWGSRSLKQLLKTMAA